MGLLSIFFSSFAAVSIWEADLQGCHGNSMCAGCSVQGTPPTPHPSLFLSGVFAFPFNQRHLFLRGLTGQKQEMQIMLTVMPIITNAKTLDARLSIANGPMGFVGKQLNSLTWY